MVYRGKPSAGCENCRKAKKRCGLEQPACLRCVKLKKTCSGYRDTTQLQIQDESEAVRQKAERQKAKNAERVTPDGAPASIVPTNDNSSGLLALPSQDGQMLGQSDSGTSSDLRFLTPFDFNTESSISSDDIIDIDLPDVDDQQFDQLRDFEEPWGTLATGWMLRPRVDEVAIKHFIDQFTANGHWGFFQRFAKQQKLDPCLMLAMKACGMAALTNVEMVPQGRDYARGAYVEALGLLNQSLRDPVKCRTDEALIAVSMLGYYENISCDGRNSIQSWKAHMNGATNLLKLRGKAQFKTIVGRMMFRELRGQILVHCIWDDIDPPEYLMEYQRELSAQTPAVNQKYVKPGDALTSLCFEFARLRAQLREARISNPLAAEQAGKLETLFIQWSIDVLSYPIGWEYHELEVEESEHVWNGTVYHYPGGFPAPSAWNTWRCMRIMLTRTREMLVRRMEIPQEEKMEQIKFFRKTRRQMTDEICATIPPCLGQAGPTAMNSPYVLITAYASVWPLFFAGTCLLERVGPDAWSILNGTPASLGAGTSAAFAQATWVINRLKYISANIGLRWADGVAAVLRGDFLTAESDIMRNSETDDPVRSYIRQITGVNRAPWLRKIEEKHRGPGALIETENPLTDVLKFKRPVWLGKEVGPDTDGKRSRLFDP